MFISLKKILSNETLRLKIMLVNKAPLIITQNANMKTGKQYLLRLFKSYFCTFMLAPLSEEDYFILENKETSIE